MKKNVGRRLFGTFVVTTVASALVIVIVCAFVLLIKTESQRDTPIPKTEIASSSAAETQQQTSYLKSFEELDSVSVGDHFTFGNYPQYAAPETEESVVDSVTFFSSTGCVLPF